ncbi:MAG: protein phosphatase 2C domain-containing protein, partial [Oscillospiraceae bacterium]
MLIYGDTDKGKIRANNQDSFAFNIVSNECAWAVVCDGMGGVNGGNVASKISVEVVFEALKRSYKNGAFNGAIKNIMQSAIVKANLAVFGQAKGNKELSGMGTTIVVVIIYNGIAYIAHAGDSRAYLINNSDIVQITRDHSIVQMMLEQGKITKEEAKYHPSKNIITRALGVSDVIDIEYNEIAFKCNDTILICTDG